MPESTRLTEGIDQINFEIVEREATPRLLMKIGIQLDQAGPSVSWEDLVLAQYLDGELDREEAIERVGRAKVKRAERELEIVEEDLEWDQTDRT